MTTLGVADFAGMLPVRDPTLLPDNYAQFAQNTWLFKGAIRGLRASQPVYTLIRPLTTKQVYRIPLNENLEDWTNSLWLEFPDPYMNVIRSPVVGDQYARYYFFPSDQFIDDGSGWFSTPFYAPLSNLRATPPGPYYLLGIPVPATAPGVVPAPVVSPNPQETRSYIYTYVSAYGEEGAPSPPTTASGDPGPGTTWTITVYSPSSANLLNRNLSGIRIYRTVTDSSGNAEFFQVNTTNIPITTPGAPIVYNDSQTADQITNNTVLNSTVYTGPPAGLQGVVMMANGIMAGWTNEREIWFSTAFLPHSWPATYALTVDYPTVALNAIGSSLSVLTEGQPFIATGTTPDTMTIGKVTANEPCIGRGSVFAAGEGTYYASPNGLILLNTSGTINVTQMFMEREFFNSLTPNTWAAGRTGLSYTAFFKGSSSEIVPNGVILDQLEKNVPAVYIQALLEPSEKIVNLYWDELSGQLFLVHNTDVRWWFAPSGGILLSWVWKSKKFRLPKPEDMKALKIHFNVPPEVTITPPTPQTRNNNQSQVFDPTKQYLIARIYANGNPVVVREIITDGEVLLIPDGQKATFWEIQLEGQVYVYMMKMAGSVKDLAKA